MQKLELLNLNCSQYFCSILFQYCGISLSSYLPDPFGECWRHWDLFQALKDAVLGLVTETTLLLGIGLVEAFSREGTFSRSWFLLECFMYNTES